MNIEDLSAADSIGWRHRHAAVEAPGTQQGEVEDLGPVGRREHDDGLDALEAIHLGEDLIECLLALVVAAGDRYLTLARAADRVEFVDEDDRRRGLFGLREQVADARRADADDRLDELRGRDREERRVGFARHRSREQGLAGSRRAREQHAVGHAATQPAVALGVAQEVDDLGQLGLGLVDPGHVGERDADRRRVDPARLRATEVTQRAGRAAACRPSREHDEQSHQQERRPKPEEQGADHRPALSRRGRIDLDVMGLQERGELVVVPERRDLGAEQRRRRSGGALGRVTHGELERSLDGVPGGGD